MSRQAKYAILVLLLSVGALLFRLPSLGNRPMHGDEAVHTFKFDDLWEKGLYRYDPNEFHGPTLYYAALPSVWLHGRRHFADTTESDYRLVTVVSGAGLALLLLLLIDGLGETAVCWAALLTAISPALVFYSRYYIQETLLAFFTLGVLTSGWRYMQSRRAGWAAAAGLSAGLMVATKETAVFAFAAMAASLGLLALWSRCFQARPFKDALSNNFPLTGSTGQPVNGVNEPIDPIDKSDSGLGTRSFLPPEASPSQTGSVQPRRSGDRRPWIGKHAALALAVALLAACLFLSGFLTNLSGPLDYLRSYTPWVERAHATELHRHPWFYYLSMLAWTHRARGPVWSEGLILVLALVGMAAALVPRFSRLLEGNANLARFLALYTLVLTILYTAVPYKTPWCVLSFLDGMILMAGVGAAVLLRWARGRVARLLILVVLLAGCGQLAWQAYITSYVYYTDGRNPYAYSQPVPDVQELERKMEDLARAFPQHDSMVVKVISTNNYYWPLPWYLRRFPNVGYWTSLPSDPSAPVVLASPEFDDALNQRIGQTHLMNHFYGLRPTILFEMWVRLDVWKSYLDAKKAHAKTSGARTDS